MARVGVVPDQVEERPALPKNHYAVEVLKATLGESAKGNTKLDLEMVVIDGPDLPENLGGGSPAGRKLSKSVWVDPKSRDLKNALEAFEIEVTSEGWEPEDFVGKQAVASVTVSKYDGDDVNQIRKFFPVEATA